MIVKTEFVDMDEVPDRPGAGQKYSKWKSIIDDLITNGKNAVKLTCENYDDGVKQASSLKWYLKRHSKIDKVGYCRRGETIYIFRKDM